MGENSKISWTNHTFNPWVGCQKVGPGCHHCYAESQMHRYGRDVWGPTAPRERTTEGNWKKVMTWDRAAGREGTRARVFCASLADVFEARDDLDPVRKDLFELIMSTKNLDWLLLTKRPEEMVNRAPPEWRDGWPDFVWAGATAENQEWFDKRYLHLLKVPAKVRFLSIEPILSGVDMGMALGDADCHHCGARFWSDEIFTGVEADVSKNDLKVMSHEVDPDYKGSKPEDHEREVCPYCEQANFGTGDVGRRSESDGDEDDPDPRIHWVIAGAESGHGARPMDYGWIRSLRDQTKLAGAKFFYKQDWISNKKIELPEIDGRRWGEIPNYPDAVPRLEVA